MRDQQRTRTAHGPSHDVERPAAQPAVGKQTLTERLVGPNAPASTHGAGSAVGKHTGTEHLVGANAPASGPARAAEPVNRPTIQALFGGVVQQRAAGGGPGAGPGAEQIHASAQRGIATASGELPHRAAIQRAFGRHDISSIQAHVGGDAAGSARDMGAQAYATGSHVVAGVTDLFTMAHEAAHVVQQRAGLHVAGGVGQVGDAHERHADEVAARVVQGESAEALLDRYTGEGAGPASAPVQHLVQRKVGFEAELSVPSFGPRPGAVDPAKLGPGPDGDLPTAAIQQFLFGGLDYGVNRGENEHFTLKPDHNALQTRMRALWAKLRTLNGQDGNRVLRQAPTINTSNLEYVTKPIDELEVNSTLAFNQQFAAIQGHVNAMFPAAKTTMAPVGAPGVETFTGVPLADLQAWAGSRWGYIAGEVAAFQAEVKNELYLQATVGIIPSAIRDLHKAHAPANPMAATTYMQLAMAHVDQAITALIASDDFKDDAYIQEMQHGKQTTGWLGGTTSHPARPIDYESFVGVLHLMLMYMVGSALNQTNLLDRSSGKNAVPFLSKMSNMRSIISSAAPGLHAHRPPAAFITFLDRELSAVPQTRVDWWLSTYNRLQDRRGTSDERRPTVRNDDFVSRMLGTNLVLPESVFGGAHVNVVGSPRSFATPDQLPEDVSRASGGQQAAQFEYRYITTRPDANGLAAELTKVVTEVRNLNLKHLSPHARQDMIHDAEHGLPQVVLDLGEL
jgi:uncharacterized protein DUF4157